VMCCGATYGSQPCIDQWSAHQTASGQPKCSPHQLSDWFLALALHKRIAFLVVSVALYRTSFYFVWYLDEAICNLGGLGYTGDGKPWDRCRHGDLSGVELSQSPQQSMASWNRGANTWLRRCVHERLLTELKWSTTSGRLVTMLVSGFWHGIYPGHISTFLGGFVLIDLGTRARSAFRPIFQNKKVAEDIAKYKEQMNKASKTIQDTAKAEIRKLDTSKSMPWWYNILGIIFTAVFLNLVAASFLTLDLGDTWAVTKHATWVVYVVIFGCYIFVTLFAMFVTKPRSRKKKAA